MGGDSHRDSPSSSPHQRESWMSAWFAREHWLITRASPTVVGGVRYLRIDLAWLQYFFMSLSVQTGEVPQTHTA